MTHHEYRELRIEAGLTPTELAGRLGESAQTINDREAGFAQITGEAAIALRAVLSGHGGGAPGHWPTPQMVVPLHKR